MKKPPQSEADKFPFRSIGARIKAVRETTAMSATDFAAVCGFNYTRYINWETGHRRIMPDEATVLCEKFGLTLDFIYRGIEAQLPQSLLIALSSSPRQSAAKISKEIPDKSAASIKSSN
ncbi:helix-turn-helix domain-containing protein [Puniceibacterium confluentis]|uniref:helix-turn-helix domain-containing protein n=1 Tax=Puniceibacterium confluentis TaxID=1958944 RepID=UPI0011B66E52|nr:helix-turn-helix transcriptional regulator [Puniceibacterium confluentis]